jgi:hypothetical protein
MLIAYDGVMNDLLLVDEGLFADMRIPRKPGERHAVANRVRNTGVRTESQFQIVSLRKHNSQARIELGDGLVSANGDKIRSWDGSKGATSVTNQIRSDQILRAALPRLSKAAAKSPGNVVSMDLESAKLYARAITYRDAACLKCHPGEKVGNVAAIAAVVRASGPISVPDVFPMTPPKTPSHGATVGPPPSRKAQRPAALLPPRNRVQSRPRL